MAKKKLFKVICRTIEFILGFFIVMVLLLFFRLSIEPIHIQNLMPSLISMIKDSDSQTDVSMKDAYIELAFSKGRLMDVCLEDVLVSDKKDFILNVDKAHVSFNPFALLIGRIVVTDVAIDKAFVQVNVATIDSKKEEKSVSVERKINRIRRIFERLDSLSLTKMELNLLLGKDKKIIAPELTASLTRDNAMMNAQVSGRFYVDKTFLNLDLLGKYSVADKKAQLKITSQDLELQKMQELVAYLKNIDMTVDISVDMDLNLKVVRSGWKNIFEKVNFSAISKNNGTLYLPKPIDTVYQIQEAVINGNISSGLTQAIIENSEVNLYGKQAEIYAKVDNLDALIFSDNFDKTTSKLKVSLKDVGFHELPELWPSYFGSTVHAWIKENVPVGKIQKASLDLQMKGNEVEKLSAILDVKDTKVVYLDTMPPLENIDAQIVFDATKAILNLHSATCHGMKATSGEVKFLDFDKDVCLFEANVLMSGSLSDALEIVSAEPLKVCDDMPISCKTLSGNAEGTLQIKFPFTDDLKDKLTFSVKADIESATFPVPKTEWQFNGGALKLQVNNEKVAISGKGILDDKTVNVDIKQSFTDELDGSYNFIMPISPSMVRPYFKNIGNFFKGSLMTNATVYPQKEGQTIALDFGLKDAEISLPIGYTKEFDKKGTLKATLVLKNNKIEDISSVYLSIPDESIILKGRVNLPKDKLFELVLDEIKAPRTDAKLTLGYNENGSFDAKVEGSSLDVEDLLYGNFFNSENKTSLNDSTDFTISAKLDKLFLSQQEPFTKVNALFKRQDGHWLDIKGSFDTTTPFTFNLDDKKTALHIYTEDVGAFLKQAGVTDRISGGILDTDLTQDKEGNLKGEIKINKFSLTKTSFFMQAATLLGILDAIRGEEYIFFDKAIIPFVLTPQNVVEIDDAVASGTALGITLRGKVSSQDVNLEGSVVPAYAINSLLGNVPIVGTIFSGEKGGGLFGVTYTVKGTLKNAEFDFNPASLLAPGIFRRLF